MPILHFEGYSDDTFGEVTHFREDYDNCANGKPIEFLLSADGEQMVVFGQHCPSNAGSWMVGVASYDPEYSDRSMANWPMRYEWAPKANSPRLVIEAPDGVTIEHLTHVD